MVACSSSPVGNGPLLVYSFENSLADEGYEVWGAWLMDMLVRDLWQSDALVVWPPGRSLDLRQRLGDTGHDRGRVVEAARDAGAGMVLLGDVSRAGDRFVLSAEILDLSGEGNPLLFSGQSEAAGIEDVFSAMDSLRDQIWSGLGVDRPAEVRSIADLTTSSSVAYGHFSIGQELYSERKFLAALESCVRAGQEDVDFVQSHYLKATAALGYVVAPQSEAQGYLTLAWTKRQNAGERDRLAIEALRALIAGEYQEALPAFEELRRRWPGDKETDYFYAAALGQMGRHPDGVAAVESAVAADPGFAAGWESLAGLAFLAGDRGRADEAVQEARAIAPGQPRLQVTSAIFDLFAGNLDAAERTIDEGLRFRAFDPGLQGAKVDLALLRWDLATAMDIVNAMRSPFMTAKVALHQGLVRAAVEELDKMTRFQMASDKLPAAAIGLWVTGLVLEANGAPELAVDQFNLAVNAEPMFLAARASLAIALARAGQTKQAELAVAGLREVGARSTQRGWERHALRVEGELALIREDYDQAIELFTRAREMAGVLFLSGAYFSDHPIHADSLARAYLAKGDLASAEAQFGDITQMWGDRLLQPWIWLGAHVNLAELAIRGKRTEEAAQHAQVVRQAWGHAGGQNQIMVDTLLQRLDRILPAE